MALNWDNVATTTKKNTGLNWDKVNTSNANQQAFNIMNQATQQGNAKSYNEVVQQPTSQTELVKQLPEYKINLPGISNTTPTVQELSKNLNMQEGKSRVEKIGDAIVSTLYGIGEKPAKGIANATLGNETGVDMYSKMVYNGMKSDAQQKLLRLALKRKGYSDEEIDNQLQQVANNAQEKIDKIDERVASDKERLNRTYEKLDKTLGKNETAKTIGNTIGYIGLAPTTGYGALSAINARADTEDPLDIAMAAGTGEAFGAISNKLGGLTKGALGKIGATNTNLLANIAKNVASGFAGTGGASLATGTLTDLYNKARGRDVNYLNTLKEAAIAGLVGGAIQGTTGTINDVKQAKAQMQSDYAKAAENVENLQRQMNHEDIQSQKVRDALAKKLQPRVDEQISNFEDAKYLGQGKAQAKLVEQLKQGNTTPVQVQNTLNTLALPSNNTNGEISKEELLNMSKDLPHEGETFIDERYANGSKTKSNIIPYKEIELNNNNINSLRSAAKEFANKRFSNAIVKNSDTGIDSIVGNKGIRETLSKDLNSAKISSLDDATIKSIEEAVYKNSAIDAEDKNNIYHYLVAMIENGEGEKALNYITLKETPNRTKFHYNTVEKIEASSLPSRPGDNAGVVVNATEESSINNSIPQNTENINNNSLSTNNDMYALRDFKEVGNRKVNAYQYDNPTVKPYFQQAAQEMLADLRDSVKAERYMTQYEGDTTFGGTPRITTADIASLLDGENGVKLSYDDIERGLKAIIEDHGAENNAKSKRIEFALDDRLRNGYTLADGMPIPANEEYLNFLQDSNQSPISMQPVQEGYTRLYRGLEQEYNPNYDRSKLDNANGYESWTDNYDLAKQYGDNVYYTDIPTNQITNSILDENPESETYGDRNLIYKNDKPVGINGINGNEYMLYTEHDNYPNVKYNKIADIKKLSNDIKPQPTQSSNIFEETNKMIQDNRNKAVEEGAKALALDSEKQSIKIPVEPSPIEKAKLEQEKIVNDPDLLFSDKAKTRSWTETAKSNKYVRDNVNLQEMYYEPQSNNTLLEKATKQLARNNYEDSMRELNANMNSGKNITDLDIAKGELLLQQAIAKGNLDEAAELASDLTIMGTELGRAVQSLSMISRLTPQGQLMHIERVVNRMNAVNEQKDSNAPEVKISNESKKQILGAKNQEELDKAIDDTLQDLADQIPATVWEKVDAWRYLAMLGNPRTHIRNVLANVVMSAETGIKNVTARAIETALQNKFETRTRTFKKASDDVKKFVAKDSEIMKDTLFGENKYNTNDIIRDKQQIFKNSLLEKARKFNIQALSAEDNIFTMKHYKNSMAEYLTANGIKTQQDIDEHPEIVSKARTHAIKEAEEATFHQSNRFAEIMQQLENSGKVGKLIVGGVMPFKKTPANIVTTGFKYSPLGLGETIINQTRKLKNGQIDANQYIDRLSQGLTGTGLTLLGTFLASMGIITASSNTKEDTYKESIGARQAYSLNVGDKSYDLSWASPAVMPIMVGAELYNTLENGQENINFNDAIDALTKTLDPLSEMSMLQSINSALRSYSNSDTSSGAILGVAKNAVKSYAGQFVPTIGSQINKVIDKTVRTTKADRTASIKDVDSFLKQTTNKIPFASFLLEPSTDVWGNDNKRDDNALVRSFEAFINPGNVSKNKATEVDKEILTLYEFNNNNDIILTIPPNYFTKDKQKYELNAKEYTQYKKDYGQTAYNALNELFNSDRYKNMSVSEKEKAVKKIYEYSLKAAKQNYLNKNK